jgi:hypothetical protein
MIKSTRDNTTPRWKRSAVTGTLIGVRLQPAHLKALDAWIDKQKEPYTRPEAIRGMIETMLHRKTPARSRLRKRKSDEGKHTVQNHGVGLRRKRDGTKALAASPNPQWTEYEMQSVDEWIARQGLKMERSEAIRRLVELGLKIKK